MSTQVKLVSLLLVAVAGCSSGNGSGTGEAATTGDSAAYAECRRLMGPLLHRLEDVDARLDVGMLNADYSNAVGDVAVAYNRVDFDKVDGACLAKVAVPLEAAYNSYSAAGRRWNGCIVGDYCDVDRDALPEMRERWSRAGSLIERARGALEDMAP